MHGKSKKADMKIIMIIAFLVILLLVLMVMTSEGGELSNKIVANIKEKLNPFS